MTTAMAVYPSDGIELGGLIEEADSAMYREKISKRMRPTIPTQF